MSMGSNYGYGYGYDNYVRTDPRITYDVPQSRNIHVVFDDNPVVFEEERQIASYEYRPTRVVFEENHAIPVHKSHHRSSIEPRKQVHFVEHDKKVIESVDNFGNQKVYKETVDTEADGFINRKHKNFELNKFGTFNSYY